MIQAFRDRCREILFMFAMCVMLTTLWVVAWSKSIQGDVDRGWLPALGVPAERDEQTHVELAPPVRLNAGAGIREAAYAEPQQPATQPTLANRSHTNLPAIADVP